MRRIAEIEGLLAQMGVLTARVKERHAAAFLTAQTLAWLIGSRLGLLDVLGEIPGGNHVHHLEANIATVPNTSAGFRSALDGERKEDDMSGAASPVRIALREFLDSDKWPYREEDDAFHTGMAGENGEFSMRVIVIDDDEDGTSLLIVSSALRMFAPQRLYAELADLMNRLNERWKMSVFSVGRDDGEIECRAMIQLPHAVFTSEVLNGILYGNALQMDEVLPAIQAVAFGGRTVEEALEIYPLD